LYRQTRQIAPQGVREVEKSEAEAQLYSALRNYPVRRTLGGLYFFGGGTFGGGSGLEGCVGMGKKVGEDNEGGEDLKELGGGIYEGGFDGSWS
jgi:hypothetical protein